MKKRNRLISILLCATVVISIMLSAAFIITYADHDCIGHGCEICYHIQLCQQTLKKTLLDAAALIGIALTGLFYVLIIIDSQDDQPDETLVSMKVKFSC